MLAFFRYLGFVLVCHNSNDAVGTLNGSKGWKIRLVINAASFSPPRNELMNVDVRRAGYRHVALKVSSHEDVLG